MAKSITIKVSEKESDQVEKALNLLVKNISPENLKILGEKSTRVGINTKIQKFKNFL